MLAGFIAGVTGKTNVMSKEAATTYMREGMNAVQEKALAVKYADNKAAGEKFLADNKTKEGVVPLRAVCNTKSSPKETVKSLLIPAR